MNDELRKDLEYRIQNLEAAISNILNLGETTDPWEDGYRIGALSKLTSERRFLEQMVATYV